MKHIVGLQQLSMLPDEPPHLLWHTCNDIAISLQVTYKSVYTP
ncbi:hypothetical protein ACO0LI_15655 [Undibacterium sp. Tian12W]